MLTFEDTIEAFRMRSGYDGPQISIPRDSLPNSYYVESAIRRDKLDSELREMGNSSSLEKE